MTSSSTLSSPTPSPDSPADPTSFSNAAPKSIFASKTIWGIVFTAIAAIAPIVGKDFDNHRHFSGQDVAQIVVILCGAASAVAGRVEASCPIYTPKYVLGPDKSSFGPPTPPPE